jgi:hypothetical protein
MSALNKSPTKEELEAIIAAARPIVQKMGVSKKLGTQQFFQMRVNCAVEINAGLFAHPRSGKGNLMQYREVNTATDADLINLATEFAPIAMRMEPGESCNISLPIEFQNKIVQAVFTLKAAAEPLDSVGECLNETDDTWTSALRRVR